MNTVFPLGVCEVYIEASGRKIAAVKSFKEEARQTNRYIECIGEGSPIATIYGKTTYLIELICVSIYNSNLKEQISFYDLYNFNVVVVFPERKIIYSGCQWFSIERTIEGNNLFLEKAVVNATERTEVTS